MNEETFIWLGKGVYIRVMGTWYHEATCPTRTAPDYLRRYFPAPPQHTAIVNGAHDIERAVTGLRLSFASSYVNLSERTAMMLATVCRRWNIPYDVQSETRKTGWRRTQTFYFFAAPINELCR